MDGWNHFLFLMVPTRMSIGLKQATWTHACLLNVINILENAWAFASAALVKYLIVRSKKYISNFEMIEIIWWLFFFFRSRSRKKKCQKGKWQNIPYFCKWWLFGENLCLFFTWLVFLSSLMPIILNKPLKLVTVLKARGILEMIIPQVIFTELFSSWHTHMHRV